jgi:hypothetical protein
LVGVSGPFAGANSDESRAGGRCVGADERLVDADGCRVEANGQSVEANEPVVCANGKPVGSHGRLEGTDGRMVLASGPRVGTHEGVVGAGFEQEQTGGTENSFSVSSVLSC